MRIVLMSPYDDRCYGLRIIASILRREGHEVTLIVFKQFVSKPVSRERLEAVRHPGPGGSSPVTETLEEGNYICCYIEPITDAEWDLLIGKISAVRPDLIGIALTTPTAAVSREITARLKREFPRLPVIWGGIHPTINPEECIPHTDMICLGEGEHPMVELARDPERTDIVGIWFNRNGTIIRNPIRPLEQNLDVFPYASWGEDEWLIEWNQLIELPKSNATYFRGIFFTMTQRGCPFSCTYCFNHVRKSQHRGERYVRRRSVDHAIAECKQRARDFDLPGFAFMDDVFVKDREWLEEFVEKWPREVGLPFGGYAHPSVSDEAMLERLASAGLRFITLGVQSGSRFIACDVYNRRHSFDGIVQLAKSVERLGLDLVYDLLSNCEYESEADCRQTLELLTRLPKPRLIQVKGLGVFPPMKIATLNYPKVCLPEATFEFWNLLYLLSRHRGISGQTLLQLSEDTYLKERPEIVRAIALALKQTDAEARAAREELEKLQAEVNDTSFSGLLRYARRYLGRVLPRPVADALRTVLGRPRPSNAGS